MRDLAMLGLLLTLAPRAAQASTFMISYEDRASADPAENFEADCLGASEAADCATRAAVLASELVELLSSLEGRRDADTIALFQAAASMDDPKLAEIGVRYFAYHGQTPQSVWDNVKEFFFGIDPGLGAASADLMTQSNDSHDVALGEHYLEGRRAYGSGIPAAGADDGWAFSQAREALIEAMLAFEESEQFTPSTRLLMNDRMVSDSFDPDGEIPITGFVTDASVADVTAFFTGVFGKAPYPSLFSSRAKLEQLNEELEALAIKLQMGDHSAAQRLTEIANEVTPVQAAVSLAELYELEDQQIGDHAFWVDGTPEDIYQGTMLRAVTVGPDRFIGRTAIRYVNGLRKDGPRPVGDGDGPDAGPSDDGPLGPRDEGDEPGKKNGGCSTRAGGSGHGHAWLLAALAIALRWRRRRASEPTYRA